MRGESVIALGLIALGLLGGCGGSGNTAITTLPTAHLAIALPATTVTAATPFTFTVKALDTMGAVVPTYAGTVRITTSDSAAKLPPAATLNRGMGTFAVTFNTMGNQTITATDTVGDAISGVSPAVSVRPIPVPKIASLSPERTVNGGVGFNLTVYGSNFVLTSVVQWNGSNRTTTFVSTGQLTAQITAADIASVGVGNVTVLNPAPGGGRSNLSVLAISGVSYPEAIAVDPSGKFAYVLNTGGTVDGSVAMYSINPASGVLASLGPPVSTNGFGVYPGDMVIDPSGRFLYVTNEGDPYGYEEGSDGGIEIYTVDAMTGALTNTGTTNGNCQGLLLCNPAPLAVDPSGKFAYVETGGAGLPFSLAMYTIATATGDLTSIGTIAAGGVPTFVAVDRTGKFVYVASANASPASAGSVLMYAMDVTTGALASKGAIAAGLDPTSLAVDPASKFAYVANSGSNDVSMYSIDATTGALTSIGTIAAGTEPSSVALDPASKFAYVANSGSDDVSVYSVNSTTGSLTLVGTVAAARAPSSIAIHPSGKFAYVTNSSSDNVSMYSINSTTGSLTLIGTIGI